MYHYLMHERWQCFFATPNMCAAFLTVCLGMLLTVLMTTKLINAVKNKNRKYCRFYYLKYENQITDIIFNLINRGND